jgi:GMP reductase
MSDYDQIYLVPKEISHIRHRGDVSLRSNFFGLYPIISSPMRGISSSSLVIEMGKNNCLGILHRFNTEEKRREDILEVNNADVLFGVAIGLNNFENELKMAKFAVDHGAILICLDIANGYLSSLIEAGNKLRNTVGTNVFLMSGNVVSSVGLKHLSNCGFDFIRVGIGTSGVCTTRNMTGIGRNQLAALRNCSFYQDNEYLVSDGGIDEPGKACKSFACGADFVMLGSALALANEAENTDGKIYGMASLTNHQLNNKEIKSIEGRELQLDNSQRKPLKEIIDQFLWGIRSCCTYLNALTYREISSKAKIVPINEKFSDDF